VAAVIPPCRLHGTALTIRKFRPSYFTINELVEAGTLSPTVATALRDAVERRDNILISVGTGTGNTTLLNALTACIPQDERVVVVGETAELQLALPNVVRLEERRAQRDMAAVTMRELLRATLRHRPDRIPVGEVRGGEAYDCCRR
jgi:pilus assembly protein CpaF